MTARRTGWSDDGQSDPAATAPTETGRAATDPVASRARLTVENGSVDTPGAWRRWTALVVVALAPVAIGLMTGPVRDRLPEPLPTHWSGTAPDGFTSFAGFTGGLLVVSVLSLLVALVALLLPRVEPAIRRGSVAAAAALAWGATALWTTVIGIAVDVPVAQSAELTWATRIFGVPAAFAPFVLVPVGLAALAASMIFGRTPQPIAPAREDADLPVARLGADERVHFATRLTAPVLGAAAAVPAVAALVTSIAGLPITVAVALGVVAVAMSTLGTARLVVDRTGLTLTLGILGWPRKRIAVGEITRASVTTVRPVEWGGWGYRVTTGRSALVLRAGPGLVVDLVDGRRFAVTLDDPATPAGLLNALRERVSG